jgi:hypothetical protein
MLLTLHKDYQTNDEVWRKHPFYNVEVSSEGNIRRTGTKHILSTNNKYRVVPVKDERNENHRRTVDARRLVVEAFFTPMIEAGVKAKIYFRDGDSENYAVRNLLVFNGVVHTGHIVEHGKRIGYCCSQCETFFDYTPEKCWIPNLPSGSRVLCRTCWNERQAVRYAAFEKNGKQYKHCYNCGRDRPSEKFSGIRATICKECRTGTGVFLMGRPRTLQHVCPMTQPKLFTRKEGKERDVRDLLLEKLEQGAFPYSSEGKERVLYMIGEIVHGYFGRPARFLLMPNLGKELAVYLKMNVIDLCKSVLVERDSLIYTALRGIRKRLSKKTLVYNMDVNDFVKQSSNLNKVFDVAHLDYNGVLTPSNKATIEALIEMGKMVFVTIQNPRRWGDTVSASLEFKDGTVFWQSEYSGLRNTSMLTIGVMPNSGIASRTRVRQFDAPRERKTGGLSEEVRAIIELLNRIEDGSPRNVLAHSRNFACNPRETYFAEMGKFFADELKRHGIERLPLRGAPAGMSQEIHARLRNWQNKVRREYTLGMLSDDRIAIVKQAGAILINPYELAFLETLKAFEVFLQDLRDGNIFSPHRLLTSQLQAYREADFAKVPQHIAERLAELGLMDKPLFDDLLWNARLDCMQKLLLDEEALLKAVHPEAPNSKNWRRLIRHFRIGLERPFEIPLTPERAQRLREMGFLEWYKRDGKRLLNHSRLAHLMSNGIGRFVTTRGTRSVSIDLGRFA